MKGQRAGVELPSGRLRAAVRLATVLAELGAWDDALTQLMLGTGARPLRRVSQQHRIVTDDGMKGDAPITQLALDDAAGERAGHRAPSGRGVILGRR
jgi:hypothetical protein